MSERPDGGHDEPEISTHTNASGNEGKSGRLRLGRRVPPSQVDIYMFSHTSGVQIFHGGREQLRRVVSEDAYPKS